MGLAHPGGSQDNHVVSTLDEAHARQLPDLAAIQGGLEVKVELLQGLDPRQARLAQPGLDATLVAALPLGLQRLVQEGLVVQLAFGGLLTDRIELGFEVIHLELFQQVRSAPLTTSS